MHSEPRRLAGALAATAALLVLAAGCAGSPDPASGGAMAGRAPVTNVTLGYVPYADDAVLFYAEQSGIFRRHGLNVSLVPHANPAAVAASLQSGTEQFGFITTPVLINLNSRGVGVKCVSSVDGQQPSSPAQDGTMLIVAKGSDITSIKDLVGKNLAVAQLSSLASLDVEVLANRAGIDPASIHQLVMPFPQMSAALSQGRVQAAVIVSPFAGTALAEGATVIDHPDTMLYPGGTVTCLGAMGPYTGARPRHHPARAHRKEATMGLTWQQGPLAPGAPGRFLRIDVRGTSCHPRRQP